MGFVSGASRWWPLPVGVFAFVLILGLISAAPAQDNSPDSSNRDCSSALGSQPQNLRELFPNVSWLDQEGRLQRSFHTAGSQLDALADALAREYEPADPLGEMGFFYLNVILEFISLDPGVDNEAVFYLFLLLNSGLEEPVETDPQVRADIEDLSRLTLLFPGTYTTAQKENLAQWITVLLKEWSQIHQTLPAPNHLIAAFLAWSFRDYPVPIHSPQLFLENIKGVFRGLSIADLRTVLVSLAEHEGAGEGVSIPKQNLKNALKNRESREKLFDGAARSTLSFLIYLHNEFMREAGSPDYKAFLASVEVALKKLWPQDAARRRVWNHIVNKSLGQQSIAQQSYFADRSLTAIEFEDDLIQRKKSFIKAVRPQFLPPDVEEESPAPKPLVVSSPRQPLPVNTKRQGPQLVPRRYRNPRNGEDQPQPTSQVNAGVVRPLDFNPVLTSSFKAQVDLLGAGFLQALQKSNLWSQLTTKPYQAGQLKHPTVPKPYRVARFSYKGEPYRIAYRIDSNNHTVELMAVGHRKHFYDTTVRFLHYSATAAPASRY